MVEVARSHPISMLTRRNAATQCINAGYHSGSYPRYLMLDGSLMLISSYQETCAYSHVRHAGFEIRSGFGMSEYDHARRYTPMGLSYP